MLLGSPLVTVAAQPAKLYSKAVALLAYLALEGRTARRDLAALLWPGASDALNNVSVTRSHIITELGDVLEADLETLALSNTITCDALEFRAYPTRAWALYRGDFLAGMRLREWKRGLGLEFEEWIETQRERFCAERLDAATALGHTAIAGRDYSAASQWLEIASSSMTDPREDAARLLMLICGATGQTDRAVAVFQRLTVALKDCLGVAPSAETLRAFEVARGDGREACKRALGVRQPLSKVSVALPLANPQHAPFVGRDAQLERGMEVLHSPSADKAQASVQLLVISGEAGAGKSRFARELLGLLDDTQLIVAGATASGPPLELLSNLTRSLGISALEARTDDLTLAAETRFLALRDAIPDGAVLMLEDLHWADEASLALLSFLSAYPPADGLRVVVTRRPALHSENVLERCLKPIQVVQRIQLEPLDTESLERLAAQMNRSDVDAAWLRKASGGNALYALELLRNAAGATQSVLELIRARIAQLGSPEQHVLESLAILDGEADLQRLQRVTGGHRAVLTTATQILEREGLVRHTAHAFALNHDLTREALLIGLSGSRLALLHLRAARATKGSEDSSALHYWASRSVWDERDGRAARRAFEVLADRCASHGNLTQALGWLERMHSISGSPAEKVRAMLKRAEWLAHYSRGDQALATLEDCAKNLIHVPDAELHAQSELIRARVLLRERNDPLSARRHLETALMRTAGLRDLKATEMHSDARMLLGYALGRLGQIEPALEQHALALQARQAHGDQRRIAESLNNIATLRQTQGDLSGAERDWTQALDIHVSLGNHAAVTAALNNLATVAWQQGKLDGALALLDRAQTSQRITGDSLIAARLEETRGAVLFEQHDYAGALVAYTGAFELHHQNGHHIEAELHCNTAEALHRLGRLDDALSHLRAACDDLEQRGSLNTGLGRYVRLLLADVHWDMSAFNEARGVLNTLGRDPPDPEVTVRRLVLDGEEADLSAALTQYPSHAQRIAVALAERSNHSEPARAALQTCTDPYWQRRLSEALEPTSDQLQTELAMLPEQRRTL